MLLQNMCLPYPYRPAISGFCNGCYGPSRVHDDGALEKMGESC